MIAETQPCIIVMELTDELVAQLQPFMVGLEITATAHNVKPSTQRLTLRGESTLRLSSAWVAHWIATSAGSRMSTKVMASSSVCARSNSPMASSWQSAAYSVGRSSSPTAPRSGACAPGWSL
jgi:hypothetical protein